MTSKSQQITVIIPTYNRINTLVQVLPSYLNDKNVKEVVIVDDCSSDSTTTTIGLLNNEKILYLKNKKNKGAPACRNIGIARAKCEFIYFGEDDLLLDKDCLRVLLEHMGKKKADIVSGRRIWMQMYENLESSLIRANKESGTIINKELLLTNCQLKIKEDAFLPLVDASMLVKKEVFKNVRYDEFYQKNAYREESDFQLSAIEKGYKILFCPHAHTWHYYKMKNTGGNHSASIMKYEYRVWKNNFYFLNKHKSILYETFGITSVWISQLHFIFFRLVNKYLIPYMSKIVRHPVQK